jgi:hypothetical protein
MPRTGEINFKKQRQSQYGWALGRHVLRGRSRPAGWRKRDYATLVAKNLLILLRLTATAAHPAIARFFGSICD